MLMLTLIALSALLMQEPSAPTAPPASTEIHTRMIVVGPDRPGGPGGLDKDADGQISREEFAAPMNDHFASMDKDGDGRLSRAEMATGLGPGGHEMMIRRGPGGEGGPHAFHLPDAADGPGEQNVIVRRMGGAGDAPDIDVDKDGRISEVEFTAPLRQAFTRMDTDGSGFIEQGERASGHDIQVFRRRVETRQNDED